MKTRIPDLRIDRLKVATYQELMKDVYDVLHENQNAAQYLPALLATLNSQLGELGAAMGESKKSQYTAPISEKDTQRDTALVMAKTLLHNTAVNGTGQAKQAAVFLEEMAKLPKVKVTPQYDQQTGEISVAVDELLGKYLTYTEVAGLKEQILQLKRLNDEMCQLLILRDTERGEQGPSRIAEIRKKMDGTYRDIILAVNSLDIVYQLGQLRGEPQSNPFAPFIDFMLGVIDRFKREILKNGGASGEIVEGEEVEEEVSEEETTTPGGSEGGGDSDNSGANGGGSGSNGNGSGNGSTGSGSTGGSNPGSGSGTGIPIQPGPGGDDPDL